MDLANQEYQLWDFKAVHSKVVTSWLWTRIRRSYFVCATRKYLACCPKEKRFFFFLLLHMRMLSKFLLTHLYVLKTWHHLVWNCFTVKLHCGKAPDTCYHVNTCLLVPFFICAYICLMLDNIWIWMNSSFWIWIVMRIIRFSPLSNQWSKNFKSHFPSISLKGNDFE